MPQQAQLKEHEASAAFWKSEETRYTKLAKAGAGSVEDKEKAIARRAEMLATIEEDKANIENAELNLEFHQHHRPVRRTHPGHQNQRGAAGA